MKLSLLTMIFPINQFFTSCIVIFIALIIVWMFFGKKKYKLPPGPTGFPNLGDEPHLELDKLKKTYGKIFRIRNGWKYTVVVGDFDVLKEAYSKTTEKDAGFDILPDALGFSGQNGEEWLEQRKFSMKAMKDLGVGKEKWESMIQAEAEEVVTLVSSFKGKPIDISKILISSVSNNISWFILGKQLPSDHPDRIFLDNIMGEIIQLLGKTLPTMQKMCMMLKIGNVYKRLKKFNDFFRKETEKLKESYKSGDNENFIPLYLKEMENQRNRPGHFFTETNLLGNIQGLFLGASETTYTAIYWLLLIMASFPNTQDEVHQELDEILGENGRIRWAERHKIPFTFATIMEGQRWRTLTPLNSLRKAVKNIKLQNYDIPKGTTILGNIWSLHNDPNYWNEPEKFNPNRFLTDSRKNIITRPDSYVPFSYGRRNCPGELIALMEILMYFTAFMQNFTVLPPKGEKPNLNGIQGITYQAIPQKLLFVPRKGKKNC